MTPREETMTAASTDGPPASVPTASVPTAGSDPYTLQHGSTAFRVERYELDLDYRLASNRLAGRATLRCIAQEPSTVVVLDLVGLNATKVQLDGQRIQKFNQRGDHLMIALKEPLSPGRAFTIDIRYDGNPRPRRGLWGEVGWEELNDGVLVAGQPNGAASWFPCNDHPRHKSSFRISVTTDDNYRAICNGQLVSRTRKSSRETWTYEQAEPMASYLATVQIGRYELIPLTGPGVRSTPDSLSVAETESAAGTERSGAQSRDGVPQYAAVPAGSAAEALAGLSRQTAMMRTFEECFGPYPFAGYTAVVTEDELEIPLEAQALSIFGRNHMRQTWEAQRLIAHELAHQWFGNSLTLESWKDIWLHEGFACYAEWIWSQESGTMTAAERAYAAWRKLKSGPQDLVVGDPGPERMFDDRVYKRGALALHALRTACGDAAFFGMLREWTAVWKHSSVSTQGFIAFADRCVPGLDAAEVLDPWLYQAALPPLP